VVQGKVVEVAGEREDVSDGGGERKKREKRGKWGKLGKHVGLGRTKEDNAGCADSVLLTQTVLIFEPSLGHVGQG
jgi:hypothetical protein